MLAGVDVPGPAPFRAEPGVLSWLGAALGSDGLAGRHLPPDPAPGRRRRRRGPPPGLWGGGLFLLGAPVWFPDGWPVKCAAGVVLLVVAPWGVHFALAPEADPGPDPARAGAGRRADPRAGAGARDGRRRRAGPPAPDRTRPPRRHRRPAGDAGPGPGHGEEELEHDGGPPPPPPPPPPSALRRARAPWSTARTRGQGDRGRTARPDPRHPPVRAGQGLETALATLTAQSPIPVRFHADLGEWSAPAIEAVAYFCTTELLANVARHSGARHASVDVRAGGGLLRLLVRDDGGGGAAIGPGSGLRGLAARLRTVDGTLDIRSPAGGPTVIAVELPLHM